MTIAGTFLKCGTVACCLVTTLAWGQDRPQDLSHTISGVVMELRSGTPDVPVCLCAADTGLPVAKGTYQPLEWGMTRADTVIENLAIVLTDQRGQFRFDSVPDGKYRLIAQKWMGPFKGPFAEHGTVIQLLGTAENVVVPRPDDMQQAQLSLTPPGRGIVEFDQEVGNNDTILFLSTEPPEYDPILGLSAMGESFVRNLLGINRMPLGRTTVIGVPPCALYAFCFAPDNSPGYCVLEVRPNQAGLVRVPREPFVAGWSDGRKTPPPQLAELLDYMDKHGVKVNELLQIPPLSAATHEAHRARMQELAQDLARQVELPGGKSVRVGDILAAESYRRLKK